MRVDESSTEQDSFAEGLEVAARSGGTERRRALAR